MTGRYFEQFAYRVGVNSFAVLTTNITERKRSEPLLRDVQRRVVLLDWTMPQMSGEDVIGALQEINPSVKIIISSGYAVDMCIACCYEPVVRCVPS
jgi:DNA-binding NarL/FixJ family response regulator